MKLPDNEPLEPEDYWTVQDTWKQEWEKGVQVRHYFDLKQGFFKKKNVFQKVNILSKNVFQVISKCFIK